MDESREKFEAWARFHMDEDQADEMLTTANSDANYSHPEVDMAWIVWKVSRAAIEVELPDKVLIEDEFDNGHNCAIDYCAESITSLGLKVKK